jgi:hypothetical protein
MKGVSTPQYAGFQIWSESFEEEKDHLLLPGFEL